MFHISTVGGTPNVACLWGEAGRRKLRSQGMQMLDWTKPQGWECTKKPSNCRMPCSGICKENPHYLCAYDQQYVEGQEELRVIELVQSNLDYWK